MLSVQNLLGQLTQLNLDGIGQEIRKFLIVNATMTGRHQASDARGKKIYNRAGLRKTRMAFELHVVKLTTKKANNQFNKNFEKSGEQSRQSFDKTGQYLRKITSLC